jgi:hypothetical protein
MICVLGNLFSPARDAEWVRAWVLEAVGSRARPTRVEQQMARVNVSDAAWVEFRSACLAKGEHVSDALGRLVSAELRRRSATQRRSSTATTPRLFDDQEA